MLHFSENIAVPTLHITHTTAEAKNICARDKKNERERSGNIKPHKVINTYLYRKRIKFKMKSHLSLL